MFIFAGASTLLMMVLLPETYAPIILLKKAKRLRKQAATPEAASAIFAEHEKQDFALGPLVHRTLYRPFQMLLLEPILVLVTVYLSVVYGVLYARTYFLFYLDTCKLLTTDLRSQCSKLSHSSLWIHTG